MVFGVKSSTENEMIAHIHLSSQTRAFALDFTRTLSPKSAVEVQTL